MIFPRRASKTATIGIIATASKPHMGYFHDGLEKIHSLGFKTIDFIQAARKQINDQIRLESLMQAVYDTQVDIVMAVRGGYGTLRILDKIDYDLIAKSRKIIIGFSDLTALSLALYKKKRMVTFCGPMMASSFYKGMPVLTQKSFIEHATGALGQDSIINLSEIGGISYRRGKAQGRLLGGNMAVMARLIGSEYMPDLRNCILFLEDIDEHPGRLENIFMQYKLSGIFDKICGLILGQFSDCFKGSHKSQQAKLLSLLDDMLIDYKFPVVYNLPFGHEDKNMTLPVGIKVELNSGTGKLKYLESPVR